MARLLVSTSLILLCLPLNLMPLRAGQQNPPPSAQATPAAPQSVACIWQGALNAGGVTLRLVLKVTAGPDGALTAKLDSPDQGATDLPVDTITLKDSALAFEMKSIGGSYTGTMNAAGTEIAGRWKQGPADLPLLFKRSEKVLTLNRPQEPPRPYPYKEEEVSYENKKDAVKLAGTLTLPSTKGPHPAALLITGSGPQDRNEALMGHKPFLVLSDYLTRRGIAVLRVDDRGVGGSSAGPAGATSENFADDVLAGVAYLKTRPEINAKQIGLIGHSEGGLVAPLAAVRSEDVAFLVLLAGPGVTGEKILYDQGALIARASGMSAEVIARNRETQELAFTVIKREKETAVAERSIRESYAKFFAGLSPAERQAGGLTEGSMEGQLKFMLAPWFRYFLTYDPRPTLLKVRCPVLAINGALDLQVPPDENLAAIEAALKEGGNRDHTALKLPGLNHLFQHARTGSPAEYGMIEETFSPDALKLIGDWITQRTEKRALAPQ